MLKIGSYMEDIPAPSSRLDVPELRAELIEASERLTHKQMACYAIGLCHHIGKCCDLTADPTLRATIAINQQWLAGQISFKQAREFAGMPMQKSREADSNRLRLFYRMCHQAALTPHVKRHALIASDFAVAVLLATDPTHTQIPLSERRWQLAFIEGQYLH